MQRNIFETDSEVQSLICWIITGILVILTIAFFDVITAKIAIVTVKLLTSGILLLTLVFGVLYAVLRMCFRRRRW